MNKISQQIIDCFKRGNKLLIFGNGGSASMSNHFVAEFVCKYKKDRRPLPAISLAANQSIITAIANDYSFEDIFYRQVIALAQKGDIIIGLSTSGKSKNVNKALRQAEALGFETIDFPREGSEVGEIQDNQLQLMHTICREVDDQFI